MVVLNRILNKPKTFDKKRVRNYFEKYMNTRGADHYEAQMTADNSEVIDQLVLQMLLGIMVINLALYLFFVKHNDSKFPTSSNSPISRN